MSALEPFSIRDTIAELDEENDRWEEIGEDHTVSQYENHEDYILGFADTAETWIRRALEVLTPEQIAAIDEKFTTERLEYMQKWRDDATT